MIGAVIDRATDEQVDTVAGKVGQIAAYTAQLEAAVRREIAAFADLSRQLAAHHAFDLVGQIPDPTAAA